MDKEHKETWDGSIPEFDPGSYVLDDHGVFRHENDYSAGPRSKDYLEPSPTLRRWLMYNQRGCCLRCGTPEWAIKTKLHVHREEPGGRYSIWNTVLLCPDCHRKWHSEHPQKEHQAPGQRPRRRRGRRSGVRQTPKDFLKRLTQRPS